MSDKNSEIGLAEMISGLREELLTAQKQGAGSDIQFEVDKIDLELKVRMEQQTQAGAGANVKFWVVNVHAGDRQKEREYNTQTIKLSLRAKDLNNPHQGKLNVRG